MAGKNIYIGAMMEKLTADMAAMSVNMQELATSMQVVRDNTGQSIQSLKVKPSNTRKLVLWTDAKTSSFTVASGATPVETILTLKSLSDGIITFMWDSFTLQNTGISSGRDIVVSIEVGGTISTVYRAPCNTTSQISVSAGSINIAVSYGSTIKLAMSATNGASQAKTMSFSSPANGFRVCYDLAEIVKDGGISVVS